MIGVVQYLLKTLNISIITLLAIASLFATLIVYFDMNYAKLTIIRLDASVPSNQNEGFVDLSEASLGYNPKLNDVIEQIGIIYNETISKCISNHKVFAEGYCDMEPLEVVYTTGISHSEFDSINKTIVSKQIGQNPSESLLRYRHDGCFPLYDFALYDKVRVGEINGISSSNYCYYKIILEKNRA